MASRPKLSTQAFLGLCVSSLALISTPSSAAIITETFTGYVPDNNLTFLNYGVPPIQENIDFLGLFGEAGAKLNGDAFSITYTTDEATPGAVAYFVTDPGVLSYSDIVGATVATTQIGTASVATTDASAGDTFRYADSPINDKNVWQISANSSGVGAIIDGVATQYYSVENQVGSPTDAFLPSYLYYTPFYHVVAADDYNGGNGFQLDLLTVNDADGNPLERIILPVSTIDVTVTGVVSPPQPPPAAARAGARRLGDDAGRLRRPGRGDARAP